MSELTTILLDLPDEMLVKIAKMLSIPEWYYLSLTCKSLKGVINTNGTFKTNVLSTECMEIPAEVLRRYWDYESRVLHMRSMKLTRLVWNKVMEKDFCPQLKKVILTDCEISDPTLPMEPKPEMFKLIRCYPSVSIYKLLWGFKESNNEASFHVEGGIRKSPYTRTVLDHWLARAYFDSSKSTHDRLPIRLMLEDYTHGRVEVFFVRKEERRELPNFVRIANKLRDLLLGALRKQGYGEEMVWGMSFSRGEQEDLFKIIVGSTSDVPCQKV